MRVFVEHWQHECCGDAFRVGDEVEWTVSAVERDHDEVVLSLGVERFEDHHDVATEHEAVRGTVRRIQVLSREHESEDDRDWTPVPGRYELREIEASPDGFAGLGGGATGRVWVETGMVVDLDE